MESPHPPAKKATPIETSDSDIKRMLAQELKLDSETGLPLLIRHAWLLQVVRDLNATTARVLQIKPSNVEDDNRFDLTLKPTHCSKNTQQSTIVLNVGQSGFLSHHIAAAKNPAQAEAHCTKILGVAMNTLDMLAVIHKTLPSDIISPVQAQKFWNRPWGVYAVKFLSVLPAQLTGLDFFQTDKHKKLRLVFKGTTPDLEGVTINVNMNAFGHSQTLAWHPDHSGMGALPEDTQNIVFRFAHAAKRCAGTISAARNHICGVDDPKYAERCVFLYPGLVSCLDLVTKEGAKIKGIKIHHTTEGRRAAEMILDQPNWVAAKNGPPHIIVDEKNRLSHNVTSGDFFMLGRILQNLGHYCRHDRWLVRPARLGYRDVSTQGLYR